LQDADVIILLVPRIPPKIKTQHILKWKKTSRPDPWIWTAAQVTSEWGVKVKEESDGTFTFKNSKYRCGLVEQQMSSGGLELMGMAPTNLAPFTQAQFLLDYLPFQPWIQQFTQDNIKPYQWVHIDLGKHQGLIGYTTYIQDDKATIVTSTDTGQQKPSILILLHELSLFYRPGNTIKH
jgi:hypothetical protein